MVVKEFYTAAPRNGGEILRRPQRKTEEGKNGGVGKSVTAKNE